MGLPETKNIYFNLVPSEFQDKHFIFSFDRTRVNHGSSGMQITSLGPIPLQSIFSSNKYNECLTQFNFNYPH